MPSVTSPADFSHVTPIGRAVAKDEAVEVDEETAARLIEQGWSESKPRKVIKAGEGRKPESTDVARTAADTQE